MQDTQATATAVRVAENDSRFRTSNERIAEVAARLEVFDPDELLPFLCECADLGCTEILRLSADEYEAVRESPVRFIHMHGHGERDLGWATVVEEQSRYTVVEKIGVAASVAAALDSGTEGGG